MPKARRKPQRQRGRPSRFTPGIEEKICERLAKGETLSSICRDKGMPDRNTVYDRICSNETFSGHIARARETGADAIAEEALRIADDGTNDTQVDKDGNEFVNHDVIQRSKLRVETRLKLLSKWFPKRYGDKVDVEHKGEVNVRVVIGGSGA